MLQNRVDPSGTIFRTSARGALMGNRGVIHNDQREITHTFKHKAWISCVLEFKGRKRTVMTPGRWTELFFFDEATAFAAGHRPCFECRREDAKKFKAYWLKGNPSYDFSLNTSISKIDEILHRERIDSDKQKVMHQRPAADLPEGTFVLLDESYFVISNNKLHHWTPVGYDNIIAIPNNTSLTVLTPESVVNAFRAGYVPQIKNLQR